MLIYQLILYSLQVHSVFAFTLLTSCKITISHWIWFICREPTDLGSAWSRTVIIFNSCFVSIIRIWFSHCQKMFFVCFINFLHMFDFLYESNRMLLKFLLWNQHPGFVRNIRNPVNMWSTYMQGGVREPLFPLSLMSKMPFSKCFLTYQNKKLNK